MSGDLFAEPSLVVILLIQFTGCIALGLTLSFVFRRSPAWAHQILFFNLIAAVLLPTLYVCVHQWGIGLLQTPTQVTPAAIPDNQPLAETPHPDVTPAQTDYAPAFILSESVSTPPLDTIKTQSKTIGVLSGRTLLTLCWGLIGIAVFIRLVFQFALGIRLLHRSQSVPDSHLHRALVSAKDKMGVTGVVDMRCSEQVRSPVIWCWGRTPVLLVQKATEQSTCPCDWEGVFCHELAHCKRLDHVSGLVAELLIVFMPWHPLVWWAHHRLLYLSELACDDWVLTAGQSETEYAESLLNLTAQKHMVCLPAIKGKEHKMKQRIDRIIKGRIGNPFVHKRWTFLVATLVVCASAGIALAQPRPQEDTVADNRPDDIAAESSMSQRQLDETQAQYNRRVALARITDGEPDASILPRQPNETHAQYNRRVALARQAAARAQSARQRPGDEADVIPPRLPNETQTQYNRRVALARQAAARARAARQRSGDETVSGPQSEMSLIGRRNVLHRLLEQLHEQHHDTEVALNNAYDEPQEHQQILRAELEMLRQQIARLEQQNQRLEQQLDRQDGDRPNLARLERERHEVDVRRDQLRAEMQELEHHLMRVREEENRDRTVELSDRLNDLMNEERRLAEVQSELDQQLARRRSRRQGPVRDRDLENPERRERQIRLREQIERTEDSLRRLEQEGRGDSEDANELRVRLDNLTDRLRSIESQQQLPERQRAARRTEPAPRGRDVSTELRIYKLEHTNPNSLLNIIRPLMDGHPGTLSADTRTRSLIISTTPNNIVRLEQIIRELDVPDARSTDDFAISNRPVTRTGRRRAVQATDDATPGVQPQAVRRLNSDVDTLRNQVNELNEQMRTMHQLLEQLVAEKTATEESR